jgi:hypothetical protein
MAMVALEIISLGENDMLAGLFVVNRPGAEPLRRLVRLIFGTGRSIEERSMLVSKVTRDIPKIINNESRLYEGDLMFYFRTLFFRSNNLYNPYHNFRHMLHVLWLCHEACRYYQQELMH